MWSTEERHRWMRLLFFGGILLYASRVVLPICSVAMATELNWNRQEVGLVLGTFFWGYSMTQFLAGYLSDRVGGELVISFSSFFWSLVTLLSAYLPYVSVRPKTVFNLFVCSRFLLGIFQGFYYPSVVSLMSQRVVSSKRNFTHAVLNAGTHMGTLICGSLGSYLIDSNGWRSPFIVIGLTGVTWSFATYVLMVRPKWKFVSASTTPVYVVVVGNGISVPQATLNSRCGPDDCSGSVKGHALSGDSIKSRLDASNSELRAHNSFSWSILLRHPPFWAMLLANFSHNNTFYIILNWCPSYFHDNYPDARSWVFNMVPWLIIFPSVLLSGFIADRLIAHGFSTTFVRKAINSVVLFGSSLFLLFLSTLENYYAALACMSLVLACLGFHSSGVLLNPQDIAPTHGGQLYGVMATVGTIPGFIGVYFVGYLLDTTHQWSFVFSSTAIFSLIGWLIYTKFGSSEPLL